MEFAGRFPGFVPGTFSRNGLEISGQKTYTPASMNSLFSDFFRDFWRGILGGVRDYLGEVLGGV